MKRTFILSLAILLSGIAVAQSPVSWTYSAIKLSPGLFEVHITATIQSGWHVYAQQQPEDAIAVPTSIKFTRNPVLTIHGNLKELGNKQHYKDADLGIEAFQYAEKVEFVQQVKLRVKGKTSLNGSISFQACTDEKCLPPATTDFSIHLTE
jgi:hypothetical protein